MRTRSSWRPDQEEFLRQNHSRLSLTTLATAVCKTETAVRSRIKVLGLSRPGRRFWRGHEDDFLRLAYPEHSAEEIRQVIGRSLGSIYQRANRFGLVERRDPAEIARIDALIREHQPRGLLDGEIAELADCSREWISERRRVLGLPSNALNERHRDKVRQKTREQLAAAGLPTLAALRVKTFRDRARAAGWPEDLRPRAVQMLNALWDHGPMTRREIADVIGMPWKGSRKSLVSNDPEGSYLAHLLARGLVVSLGRAHRVTGQGRGKSCHVYTLAFDIDRQPLSLHQPVGENDAATGERHEQDQRDSAGVESSSRCGAA